MGGRVGDLAMAYRSSTQIATTAGLSTQLIVNRPAGVVQNDIIHLFWVNGGATGSVITWPAGFTEYAQVADTTTPDTKTIRAAWKRAGSSEPATYTVSTDIGGGDKCVLIAVAHSGRHLTTAPTAVATTQQTAQADPVSIAATGFTATDGDDVIWFAAQVGSGGEAVFLWDYAPPTNYTERQEADADAYTSGAAATRDNISAGATGTITGTMTSPDATEAGYGAFVIRLPAAAGGSVSEPVTNAQAVFQGQSVSVRITAPVLSANAVFEGANVAGLTNEDRIEPLAAAQAVVEGQQVLFGFSFVRDHVEAAWEGQEVTFDLRYSGLVGQAVWQGQNVDLRSGSSRIEPILGASAVFSPSVIGLTATGIIASDDMVEDNRTIVRPMAFSLTNTDR